MNLRVTFTRAFSWCPGVAAAARFIPENEVSDGRAEMISIFTVIAFFGLIVYSIQAKPISHEHDLLFINCTVYEYDDTPIGPSTASSWSHRSLIFFTTGLRTKESDMRIYLDCWKDDPYWPPG